MDFGSGRRLVINNSADGEYLIVESLPTEEEIKQAINTSKKFPPCSGVYLDKNQCDELEKFIPRLHVEYVRMCTGHAVKLFEPLGKDYYLTSSSGEYNIFHIRKYYTCPKTGLLKPTKMGIALRNQEVIPFTGLFPDYMRRMRKARAEVSAEIAKVRATCTAVIKSDGMCAEKAKSDKGFEDITDEEMSTLEVEVGSEEGEYFEDGQRVETDEDEK